MAVLKFRIIDHFGRDIEEDLNLATGHDEAGEPPLPPPLDPPALPNPPEDPQAAPVDASEGEKGQSDGQSFAISEGGQDNTTFFTDAKEGPALKESARECQSDLLQTGTDGVIPVATLVKVLDGFKGIEDGEKQVAFLLAGWGREGLQDKRKGKLATNHYHIFIYLYMYTYIT